MKILIVGPAPHWVVGGIETYNSKLIKNFLDNGHFVDEMIISPKKKVLSPVNKEKLNSKIVFFESKSRMYPIKAMRFLKKSLSNYDVVINSTKLYSKRILESPNHILVQHFPYENYDLTNETKSFKVKYFFDSFFLRIGYFGDPFTISANCVFFSKYTNTKHAVNANYIPLTHTSDLLKINDRKKIAFWMARLETQKGIEHLIEISTKTKSKIVVAGSGKFENKISQIFKENFIGKIESKNVDEYLSKARVFLMTSNFEGAAYTVAESLANGLPVIMFNTFAHAKFYAESKAVFLIDPFDYNAFANKIDWIMDLEDNKYNILRDEAKSFAFSKISDVIFNDEWNKLVSIVATKS